MTYSYFNGTDMGDFSVYMNDVTSGFFWFLILLGFYAITFFSLKIYSTQRAFGASSVLTGMLGGIMFALGLINSDMAIGLIVLAGLGIVALWAEKSQYRS